MAFGNECIFWILMKIYFHTYICKYICEYTNTYEYKYDNIKNTNLFLAHAVHFHSSHFMFPGAFNFFMQSRTSQEKGNAPICWQSWAFLHSEYCMCRMDAEDIEQ